MDEKRKTYLHLSEKNSLLPREETLEIKNDKKKFTIGIPHETDPNERRISLVPNAVELLVQNGHQVVMEHHAGDGAHFSDHLYAEAGARFSDHPEEVFQSDIVVKIAAPVEKEVQMMKRNSILFSSITSQSRNKKYFKQLMEKKTHSIAFELIKDKTGAFPMLRSMSEIIGNASIMIASEYLSHPDYGKGVMLGGFPGIRPSEVVIIGAGTVAGYAARTAMGMGAQVKIFDDSIYKLRHLQNMMSDRIFTSILQPTLLLKALKEADVVIAAKHSVTGQSSCIVPEDMVKQMKAGAVIVDVSIDQGGCFETSKPTSHQHPVYKMHGVTHYCVPNIASRVPHTASYSLSNFLTTLLLQMADAGSIEQYIMRNKGFGKGVYLYSGILTNRNIGTSLGLAFRDLDLLMAAMR